MVVVCKQDKASMMVHEFPFDPTYGYSQLQLEAIVPPPSPADFSEFWQDTYRQVVALRPQYELQEIACPREDWQLFALTFRGWGDFSVGGWLLKPRGKMVQGMIVGHGYGGRDGPDPWDLLNPFTAYLYVCGRGFNRSARAELPNNSFEHVVYDIQARERYLIRFCVADLWTATSVLLAMHPELAGQIGYNGSSFGGGLGALAVAWESRWSKAVLDIPTFGHHPLRLTMPMVGSGQAVSDYHRKHPEVREVLGYYDAATAVTFSTCPCLLGVALFDPAVPPPGQWAIANAYGGRKQMVVHAAAHFSGYEEEAEDQRGWKNAVRAWETPGE